MDVLFSSRIWLSGVALSGVLFISGLNVPLPSLAAENTPNELTKVAQIPTGKYAQIIRKQLKWEPSVSKRIPTTVLNGKKSTSIAEKKLSKINTISKKENTGIDREISRGSSNIDDLINLAFSLQGIPYLFGGTGFNGIDCSGFVQLVFAKSGINLPRISFEQYQMGVPVSRNELCPGDLVFFQTYRPGASDVRIYVGGGRTIGAASDGVALHSLSESYWTKHYLGARRVLQ